jgi:hypothetical protein
MSSFEKVADQSPIFDKVSIGYVQSAPCVHMEVKFIEIDLVLLRHFLRYLGERRLKMGVQERIVRLITAILLAAVNGEIEKCFSFSPLLLIGFDEVVHVLRPTLFT